MWYIVNMTHSDLDSDRLFPVKSIPPNITNKPRCRKGTQAILDKVNFTGLDHNTVHYSRISQKMCSDALP